MPLRARASSFLVFPLMLSAASFASNSARADEGVAAVRSLLANPSDLSARLSRTSPLIGAARSRVAQAQSDVSTTHLIPNPVLDASLSGIPLGHGNNARFADSSVWNFGVSETLELGKRGPRQASADLRAQASRRYFVGAITDRAASARLAMANAVRLQLRTLTLEESLHDSERATELERVRYEQKALAGMDYDRLLLELQNVEADVAQSRADFEAALAECDAELLGHCDLAGTSEVELDQALPLGELRIDETEIAKRPDVEGIRLESEAARKDAELARRRALPDLTLRVGYQRDNTAGGGMAVDSVSVGMTVPLPLSDRGQHDASKALSRAQELELQRSALLITARSDLQSLLKHKQALEHTRAVLERDSVPRAKSVLESTQQAFDHGGISLTDFLLARRTYVAIRLTLLEQRYQLFTIRNDLYRVLGLDARGHENDR